MASLVVAGDTSGSVTLSAPSVSGSTVLTLPTTTGTLVVTGGAQTIEFADGSAAAPSITNSGDTNTGIFFPAADTIAFTEGGVESMRIDSSGRVGIGETTPGNTLSIKAPVATTLLTSSTGTNTVYTQYTNTGGSFYVGRDNSTGGTFGAIYGSYLYSEGAYPLVTWINGSERMRITSGGYVKASNNGTYVSSTGTYHEFINTASDPSIFVTATNTSYGSNAQITDVYRSANSGYNFGLYRSGAVGSQDSEFVLRGDGQAYADGTWNNNGADYAEFFESATGQAIPVGSTVVLDGNKVRLATASDSADDVIGVVRPKEPSKASMIVGNTAWNKWANKYLSDDFDRYIMEDHNVVEWTDEDGKSHSYESHNIPANVVVPADAVVKTHDDKGNKFQHYKLNPAWNPDAEYVNRENRDEWLIIGLVGQVKVLKGQKMGSRWVKMRDVSANVEEWFIR